MRCPTTDEPGDSLGANRKEITMNTTLKTIALLAALSTPVAVVAQQDDPAGTNSAPMMQGDEGGMMKMMAEMGPMMEACTEMMNAKTEKMQNGAPTEGQSKG